eukprot:74791-Rhodomonas_salina.5
MSSTDLAYGAIALRAATRCPRMTLSRYYAMSVTDLAYDALALRAAPRCPHSGTDLAYDASSPCACSAMSGTELAYGATRSGWVKRS